ncbi:hypothetical protein HME9302_00527 [Alteripontixanthobacter maritimus]|uniref:Division/cell wall cluster transcriptional repressor MraZ n=1 Tax=Alteripontixanthobacter maritimus TaxID=2161824 RepID=A0A369Q4H6_9SPHN|nr:division/cell wall cluster transcriptional repressor MraZ [Alteripontixanthobacter maritimus]RDC59340.1 hypothetical protein HME9302_00527 [Alteripontixanthobacter maritimus]
MAGAEVNFNGQGFSPAGDKSRFVLPPKFRKKIIEASEGRTLCLVADDTLNCLVGFGLSRENQLSQQLENEKRAAETLGKPFDYVTRSQQLFGYEEISFDDSGRFVMPSYLASLANISGGLYFRGGGPFFTLWAPEELHKMGPGWAQAKAGCAEMEAQAQAKAKKK